MAREVPAALAVELCGQDLLGFLADFARRRGRLDCEAWAEERRCSGTSSAKMSTPGRSKARAMRGR